MSQSRDLTTFEISCLNNIRANDHCRILPPPRHPLLPPFIHQQKEKCNTVRPQRFLLHCLFCMPVVTSSVPILHRFLLLESHNLPEPRRVFLLHNLHEGCCTGKVHQQSCTSVLGRKPQRFQHPAAHSSTFIIGLHTVAFDYILPPHLLPAQKVTVTAGQSQS